MLPLIRQTTIEPAELQYLELAKETVVSAITDAPDELAAQAWSLCNGSPYRSVYRRSYGYLNPVQMWELKSEADLASLALREITEPITAFLQEICKRLVEFGEFPPGTHVQHFSQDTSHGKRSVTDYSWDSIFPTGTWEDRCCSLAVLELKRPYCLVPTDFSEAIIESPSDFTRTLYRNEATILGTNAVPLVQQCVKYSR